MAPLASFFPPEQTSISLVLWIVGALQLGALHWFLRHRRHLLHEATWVLCIQVLVNLVVFVGGDSRATFKVVLPSEVRYPPLHFLCGLLTGNPLTCESSCSPVRQSQPCSCPATPCS